MIEFDKTRLRHTKLIAILSSHCVVSSQCLQLCKQNLHQLFIYLLAITVWVYTFLILKYALFWEAFFRAGNNITGGSNRGGEQEDEWNPEAKFGPSMALKSIENTIGEVSVKSQHTTHHSNKAMAIQWCQSPFVALTGSKESCCRNQTCQS